ncbi:MAG: hypothetical protein ACI4M5_01910 [Christensenellales bacterium]
MMQSLSNSNPDKISCYVGFAVKSGKIIWGLDMLKKSKKPPRIIIIDGSIGSNSAKEAEYYAAKNDVDVLHLPSQSLGIMLKRNNVKLIAVTDDNLAKAILKISE